ERCNFGSEGHSLSTPIQIARNFDWLAYIMNLDVQVQTRDVIRRSVLRSHEIHKPNHAVANADGPAQIGAGSYALFGKTAECKRRVDSKFSGQRRSLPNKLRHRFYVQSGACDMALYRRRYLPHVCRNGCSDTAGIEAEVI